MSKNSAFTTPIIGRDAEFRVLDELNRATLMKTFQIDSGDLEILPGSYSAAAIEFKPVSVTLTAEASRAFDDFAAENVQNMFRQAMGWPPQFKLPPRRPTCEWIDDG